MLPKTETLRGVACFFVCVCVFFFFLRRERRWFADIAVKVSMCMYAKSLQSWLTLCNPMDCSPPGSSVYGILQARIVEWIDMPSSRGSSQPRDQTHVFMSLPLTGGFFTTTTIWEAEHGYREN